MERKKKKIHNIHVCVYTQRVFNEVFNIELCHIKFRMKGRKKTLHVFVCLYIGLCVYMWRVCTHVLCMHVLCMHV